jgi:hypothetical protein
MSVESRRDPIERMDGLGYPPPTPGQPAPINPKLDWSGLSELAAIFRP